MSNAAHPDFIDFLRSVLDEKGRVIITHDVYLEEFDVYGDYRILPDRIYPVLTPAVRRPQGAAARYPNGVVVDTRPMQAAFALADQMGIIVEQIDMENRTITFATYQQPVRP